MGLFEKWKTKTGAYADHVIVSIADGEMIAPSKIVDMTFSKELMGQTIGFRLNDGKICSPANGKVEVLYPSKHAFAIRMKDGTGLLIHIGIDTVNLNGKGFRALVKQGDAVSANDVIIEVDLALLKEAGYDPTTMLIVTEPADSNNKIEFKDFGSVQRGQIITR